MFAYQDLWTPETSSANALSPPAREFSPDNNFQSADEVKGVLTKYRKYYGTHNIKSYLAGNRKQRQYMCRRRRNLEMMPTTRRARWI